MESEVKQKVSCCGESVLGTWSRTQGPSTPHGRFARSPAANSGPAGDSTCESLGMTLRAGDAGDFDRVKGVHVATGSESIANFFELRQEAV